MAARTGLPLHRVYRLARHLARWKRARVVTVVRLDSTFAVDPRAPPPQDAPAAAVLAAFGPARRLGDALDALERGFPGGRARARAMDAVLGAVRAGHLRELHTYVLRIDGAPPPGLEAAANAAANAAYEFGAARENPDDPRPPFPFAGDEFSAAAPPPPPAARRLDAARPPPRRRARLPHAPAAPPRLPRPVALL